MLRRIWIPLLFLVIILGVYAASQSALKASLIFPLLFIFLLTGFPIALSLGIATVLYLYYFTSIPLETIPQKMFTNLDSFPLMAVPFFVLASNIFSVGGVADRLINMSRAFFGHLPGGLAISGVTACALFAAVSGSSPGPATRPATRSAAWPPPARSGS
jgi:C4-dicarboxylate transporter DctM subunit